MMCDRSPQIELGSHMGVIYLQLVILGHGLGVSAESSVYASPQYPSLPPHSQWQSWWS